MKVIDILTKIQEGRILELPEKILLTTERNCDLNEFVMKRDDTQKTYVCEKGTLLDVAKEMARNWEQMMNFEVKIAENYLENGDYYYFMGTRGETLQGQWVDSYIDYRRKEIGNVFKSPLEVEEKSKRIKIKNKLQEIAKRLGKPTEKDWKNDNICKNCITLDFKRNTIALSGTYYYKDDNVYCLSNDFLEIAKEEIGEENLIQYLKGE